MTRAVGLRAWILRMASRACESAAAVTVQVFMTTTSAPAESDAGQAAAIAQLAFDRGAVGLRGTAAELFDMKGRHLFSRAKR